MTKNMLDIIVLMSAAGIKKREMKTFLKLRNLAICNLLKPFIHVFISPFPMKKVISFEHLIYISSVLSRRVMKLSRHCSTNSSCTCPLCQTWRSHRGYKTR